MKKKQERPRIRVLTKLGDHTGPEVIWMFGDNMSKKKEDHPAAVRDSKLTAADVTVLMQIAADVAGLTKRMEKLEDIVKAIDSRYIDWSEVKEEHRRYPAHG
jgi:hypothetical protein